MSRNRPKGRGPKLPGNLLKELGIPSQSNLPRHNQAAPRRRRDANSAGRGRRQREPREFEAADLDDDDSIGDFEDDSDEAEAGPSTFSKNQAKTTRPTKEKVDPEDRAIAELERKLGLKKRKSKTLPKSFRDDGLDQFLENFEEHSEIDDGQAGDQSKKRKSEAEDWLAKKRRKSAQDSLIITSDGDEEQEYVSVDDEHMFEGFQSDEEGEGASDGQRSENSDSPPPVRQPILTGKYVAPGRRGNAGRTEADTRRAKALGLVNRLSEEKLIDIVKDLRKQFSADLVVTLIEVVMKRVCEPMALDEAELFLDAGFVAALHKVWGQTFSYPFLRELIARFEGQFTQALSVQADGHLPTKETSNLISLLCGLYNFQVVENDLVFDYINFFLEDLSELSSELLLRIFRMSGPQLRKDGPMSLKAVVESLRPRTASKKDLSVRTKFMIETIHDLKNGKPSKGSKETFQRLSNRLQSIRKRLVDLHSDVPAEPLQLRRDKVLASPNWESAGDGGLDAVEFSDSEEDSDDSDYEGLFLERRIEKLAKEQGLVTPIQRKIFVALVGASNDTDGYCRVLKLHLNKWERPELVHVLLHCTGAEQPYNPYYTDVAKRLCKDHITRQAFQFGLWKFFRERLGETVFGEDAETDSEETETKTVVGVSAMFGRLIGSCFVGVNVLRCLNLFSLQERTSVFVQLLLLNVFRECWAAKGDKGEAIRRIFAQAGKGDRGRELAQGLEYFLQEVMARTGQAKGPKELKKIRETCLVAREPLRALLED